MWSPLPASARVEVSLPASLRDKPGIWPGEHQGDMAVAEPADHVGRRTVGVIQADDLADALAVRAIRVRQAAYLGLQGELPLVAGAAAPNFLAPATLAAGGAGLLGPRSPAGGPLGPPRRSRPGSPHGVARGDNARRTMIPAA